MQAGILGGRVTGASEFVLELIKIPTVKRADLSSLTSQSKERTSSARLSEPEVNPFSPDESLEKVVSEDFPSPDKSLKVNLFSTNKSLVKVIVDFPSPDKSVKKVKSRLRQLGDES